MNLLHYCQFNEGSRLALRDACQRVLTGALPEGSYVMRPLPSRGSGAFVVEAAQAGEGGRLLTWASATRAVDYLEPHPYRADPLVPEDLVSSCEDVILVAKNAGLTVVRMYPMRGTGENGEGNVRRVWVGVRNRNRIGYLEARPGWGENEILPQLKELLSFPMVCPKCKTAVSDPEMIFHGSMGMEWCVWCEAGFRGEAS